MNRFGKNSMWVASAALLAASVLLWHMGSAAGQNAKGFNRAAITAMDNADALRNRMRHKLPSGRKARPVPEVVALTLSELRHAATAEDLVLNHISVIGNARRSNSGLQNIADAAKPAPGMPGLDQITLSVSGNWRSLSGVKDFLRVLSKYPARITALNISQGYIRIGVSLYGLR